MGSKHPQNSQHQNRNESLKMQEVINKNHFEFLYVIGRGGFGKVWKIKNKKDTKHYALKEMSKLKILDKKSERSIKYEKHLLSNMRHPFLINMHYAFQDYENLYLVMDLLNGGDLRYHIGRHKVFTEEQATCIVLGLEYIHDNNIIHRDIKPENLVLDERGYVRITDFGVAKLSERENSAETSGTPGYMSPEVMCGQNHTIAVDYFALGVIGYEFMNGKRPYLGKSRKEIKEQILAKQIQIRPNEKPEEWSNEAADFINRCLQRKASNRLGFRGPQEVKDHPWLKYYPWQQLYEKTLEAPFIPKLGDNFDKKYCEMPERIGNDTQERYTRCLHNDNYTMIFNEFTCCNTDGLDSHDNSYTNANLEQMKIKLKIGNSSNTKSNSNTNLNHKLHVKTSNDTAGDNKLRNVKVYLNNLNKTKLNSINSLNSTSTTNKVGKLTFNSINYDKAKILNLNTNTNHRAYIQPLSLTINSTNVNVNANSYSNSNSNNNSNSKSNSNNNSNFHSQELKKIPLIQNSAKIESSSNPSGMYSANTLHRNKTNSLLNKQVNHINGFSNTSTNNSSNSNTSNMPTNYMILPREKRTNSMIGIQSPIGAISLLPKGKDLLPRSSSNFNTNAIIGNSFNRKKNSCEINMKEYEKYKISKVFSKNSQSISGPVSLQLGNHLKKNSISDLVGKLK